MKSFSSDTSGFSLVEAIVSLAIVALLASLASESFRYAAGTRARISTLAAKFDESYALRRALERSVSSSATVQLDGDHESDRPKFWGSPTELTFAAPLPESIYHGAPGQYRLALSRNGEWLLGWRIDEISVSGESDNGVVTLAKDVTEVSIEYFGPISTNQSGWVSSWTRKRLPQLVGFHWRQANENKQLTVRIVSARADCSPNNIAFARDCLE